MILDDSFSDAVLDILSASEYKFDIRMYDEYLTPTLVPENAIWIYIKKQNTFFKMPNPKENNMNLVIYIMNNEIITLIKHAIKRIRAIAAQYGIVVDINVLSNKNRKKTFTNIIGKYLEQNKNKVNESYDKKAFRADDKDALRSAEVYRKTDNRKEKLTLLSLHKLRRIRESRKYELLKKYQIMNIIYSKPVEDEGGADMGGL